MNTFTPALGCLPNDPTKPKAALPKYGGQLIPRDQWKGPPITFLKDYVPKGMCQFDLPACCTYSQVKQYLTMYAYVCGRPGFKPVEISCAAMHQEVTGGNMDQGARPVDTMKLACEKGYVPASKEAPVFFKQPRRYSGAGREMFKPHEQEEVTTEDEIVSALMSDSALNLCMDWREGDTNPGPKGELKMSAGRVLGGHSIIGCGVRFDYPHSPSGRAALIGNHHGDEESSGGVNEFGQRSGVWGDNGFAWVPIELVVDGARKYTCTVLRTVQVRNEDLLG